jgi:hypothetical protein
MMTNAEKLRAMSDEDLAHAILNIYGFDTYCREFRECLQLMNLGVDIGEDRCAACVLKWLREEAKDV